MLRRTVIGPLGLLALLVTGTAARADTDLVPPVAQLFAWNAKHRAEAGPASCAASRGAALPLADARRREALARIAALMAAEPGRAEPLDGRGYAYPVVRDPNAELRRVVLEAQRRPASAGGRD
jgi:hypothetical protein